MSDVKHTPGPWTVEGPKKMTIACRVHQVINGDRYPSAFVPAWDRPEDGEEDGTEEAIANARLIAASPDLLEALEAVTSSCTSSAASMSEGQTRIVTAPSRDSLVKALAAIAKAEGQA